MGKKKGNTEIAVMDLGIKCFLTGGTLTHGQNLIYSVDGGPQLVSQSNTITEDTSGIAGLISRMKAQVDEAIRSDRMKPSEGMRLLDDYERGLKEYTYLTF